MEEAPTPDTPEEVVTAPVPKAEDLLNLARITAFNADLQARATARFARAMVALLQLVERNNGETGILPHEAEECRSAIVAAVRDMGPLLQASHDLLPSLLMALRLASEVPPGRPQ